MSSFVCSATHFNSIENKLNQLLLNPDFFSYPLLEYGLDRNHFSPDRIKKEVKSLMDGLRELNVVCVSYQYSHHINGSITDHIKTELTELKQKSEIRPLQNVELYNGLVCLSYQIEVEYLQGKREDLYFYHAFLEVLINSVARHICDRIEGENIIKWSIN